MSAAQMVRYIRHLTEDFDDSTRLRTFPSPPTVHLSATSKESFRTIARQAVQTLNAALPLDFQVTIGADLPASTRLDDLASGQIFTILTASNLDWEFPQSNAAGLATIRGTGYKDSIHRKTRKATIALTEQYGTRYFYSTLLHELIHAIAIPHHPTPAVAPGSLLINEPSSRTDILPPEPLPAIDAHLLHVAYSRLSPGPRPRPGAFTAADLGPWDDQFHLRGEIAGAGIEFGASTQNGIGDAWATGPGTRTDLRANSALGSTATWNGALVGFARNDRTVAGDAAITVTLATLRGSAAFTGLESFGDRAVPGAAGTGTRWGDDDLRYAISVDGNAFRETAASADAGFLEGAFTGEGHEGAIGTLRRPDLTAAFGAVR